MKQKELNKILEQHKLWIYTDSKQGKRADLGGANLCKANLCDADLSRVDLSGADLSDADLSDADLRGADLRGADLRGAYLSGANLSGADLSRVDLSGADLSDADLRGADLSHANLSNTALPHYSVVPDSGAFVGWKKRADGAIIKLQIPASAKRMNSLISRKCRASKAKILAIYGGNNCNLNGTHFGGITYDKVGKTVHPDNYDDDIRVDCTNGIHFFITRKEAEDWM